jgi:tetratricopeptide (TPR) repeat protein
MTTPNGSPAAPWWDRRSMWMVAALFAAVLIAYWPVLSAGYLWDDSGHVTRADLRSLGGLYRIWFEFGATQQYYPLLHSAFWLESHLWGDSAAGYHLVNVLLHATSACLLAGLLRRLEIPGSWIAAWLFALHPVAVESVAWISEQKNTLSTVLYLCAALAYVRFDQERNAKSYATASLLFLAALCTKTVSATLPAALLVVFWYRRGRLELRRDVLPVLPWFGLSLAAALTTSWFEHHLIGASGSAFELGVVERCLLAGRVFWFYLGKLLWPSNLIFIYPRWHVDPSLAWQYLFPLAALGLLFVCWLRRRRGLLAGLLLFAGALFPALGFVNVFPFIFSFVADHFQYLPDLAFWSLVGAVVAPVLARLQPAVGMVLVGVMALGLGLLTRNQTHVYHDEFSLYESTLAKNPDTWMAHNNLAIALVNAGRAAEALPHYEAALKLRQNYAEAENNFGYALTLLGRPADALPHLDHAVALRSDYAEAHNNRGIALMELNRAAEGQTEFETALKLRPEYPEAHLNLGMALARSARTDEAIAQFQQAVQLRPEYAEAELNWAIGLTLTDRTDEAFTHFRRAIELNPNLAEPHVMYGRALARAGRLAESVEEYRAALELDPSSADAHLNLAIALRQLGRIPEAEHEMSEARRLGAR